MADKKITPKKSEGNSSSKEGKAATRVTKKKVHRRSAKRTHRQA